MRSEFRGWMMLGSTPLLLAYVVGTSSLPTREEALEAAFPSASIRSERIFLTEQQRQQAEALAQVEIPSPLIARYSAYRNGKEIGCAYADTHVVRTKKETLLIFLDESGKVRRIEVTAFLEPQEYIAPARWYEQFRDKSLSPDLSLQRAIRPVAGATLTAIVTNRAVRRVLAIDQVLRGAGKDTP